MTIRTVILLAFILFLLCIISCATTSCLNEKGENVCRQNRIEHFGPRDKFR